MTRGNADLYVSAGDFEAHIPGARGKKRQTAINIAHDIHAFAASALTHSDSAHPQGPEEGTAPSGNAKSTGERYRENWEKIFGKKE